VMAFCMLNKIFPTANEVCRRRQFGTHFNVST
jgi:hypothetical protein